MLYIFRIKEGQRRLQTELVGNIKHVFQFNIMATCRLFAVMVVLTGLHLVALLCLNQWIPYGAIIDAGSCVVDAFRLWSTRRECIHFLDLRGAFYSFSLVEWIIGRFYLRLQHAWVDFVMQGKELPEQYLLVWVFDVWVLFEELLLYLIQFYRVYCLDRTVDVKLWVPPTANVLKHHGRRLNLTDASYTVL